MALNGLSQETRKRFLGVPCPAVLWQEKRRQQPIHLEQSRGRHRNLVRREIQEAVRKKVPDTQAPQ
jgi:hypothetical protein